MDWKEEKERLREDAALGEAKARNAYDRARDEAEKLGKEAKEKAEDFSSRARDEIDRLKARF